MIHPKSNKPFLQFRIWAVRSNAQSRKWSFALINKNEKLSGCCCNCPCCYCLCGCPVVLLLLPAAVASCCHHCCCQLLPAATSSCCCYCCPATLLPLLSCCPATLLSLFSLLLLPMMLIRISRAPQFRISSAPLPKPSIAVVLELFEELGKNETLSF